MKKSEVVRSYNFPDSRLVSITREKIAFMRRDAEAFIPFGVTSALLTALETAVTTFADSVTDIEVLSDQTGITVEKDAKADELRMAIRAIMVRVEMKYKAGSAKYKKFGTEALARQTDAELLIVGKRVARVGNEMLDDLADNGITDETFTDLIALCDDFEDLMLDMRVKMADRDIVQEERVEAGNAIYAHLASYTTIGQTIWKATNAAKYNDYIIYDTVSAHEPTVDIPPV